MVSRVIPVEEFDLVIFGATGDLARRKILPGLYLRFLDGQMPENARIIGAARTELSSASFKNEVEQALREFLPTSRIDSAKLAEFRDTLSYVQIDALGEQGWAELKTQVTGDRISAYYFSVGPSLFGPIAQRLNHTGLAYENSRIVLEKPFGHDLASAKELNAALAAHFSERQIYRIDHYLGKETVQNLMALRFGNMLFEPLWNAQYVDHIQITVAETVSVAGRGGYYDKAGAMRDMVQNHLMQLLCLTAMEPPSRFEPDAVRDEKLKIIRALDPVPPNDIVRGQYGAGEDSASYLDDIDADHSNTESFIAMKVKISNWRWNGTPFYLRTGKRMSDRVSEIVVRFKEPPHSIFEKDTGQSANELSIRLQPNEGMDMRVTIKEPGLGGMRLIEVPLDMTFAEALGDEVANAPDAYERLIMDVIRGDQTLFMRGDEVEAAWAWADPIIESWTGRADKPIVYDPATTGPEDAMILLHRDSRRWRDIRT